jgi:hypothetical protein
VEIISGNQGQEVEWQHPLLKGKSPEEVERIFALQQSSLQEVTQEANTLHERLQNQPSAPSPKEEEDDGDYGDDFLAPKFERFERRLTRQMDEMVKPLRESFAKEGARSVRDTLRGELPHFTTLEPHIDKIIREQGQNPATASDGYLRMVYHTALGVATARGIDLNELAAESGTAPAPTPSRQEKPSVSIPQHRPSSAPLPDTTPKAKVRELTEDERRLAKEFFPDSQNPEEDYRNLQDADEFDVVKPGFSKETW